MDINEPLINCENCENKSLQTKLLSSSELGLISGNCNLVSFKSNELIFKQGTPSVYLLFLRKGLVKICNESTKNRKLIIQLMIPGNYIGLSCLLSNNTYNFSAITIEPSDICFIKKDVFIQLMSQNNPYATKIIEYNCNLEGFLAKRLCSIIHKQVPGRVADLIIYFSREIFNSNTFEIPLSRTELADFIGVSKKSFIKTLSEFNNDKLLKVDDRKIEVLRIDLIERLSKLG